MPGATVAFHCPHELAPCVPAHEGTVLSLHRASMPQCPGLYRADPGQCAPNISRDAMELKMPAECPLHLYALMTSRGHGSPSNAAAYLSSRAQMLTWLLGTLVSAGLAGRRGSID